MHGRDFTKLRACVGAEHRRIRQPAGDQRQQRIANRPRLLEDLLLHIVPVRAALHGFGAELALHHRPFHGFAAGAGDLDAAGSEQSQVSVTQKAVAAGHREQRGNVGSGVVLRFAQAHDHRRTAMGGQDRIRLAGRQDDDGKTALQPGQRIAHRRNKILAGVQFRVDKVGDAFGVRFARENHAPGRELRLDRLVVLYDAVVRDRYPVAGEDGMRVLFRGRAVRGPAVWAMPTSPSRGFLFEFPASRATLPGRRRRFRPPLSSSAIPAES